MDVAVRQDQLAANDRAWATTGNWQPVESPHYFAPADSRLFVPKRRDRLVARGWAINHGHRWAPFVCTAMLFGPVVALCLVMLVFGGGE